METYLKYHVDSYEIILEFNQDVWTLHILNMHTRQAQVESLDGTMSEQEAITWVQNFMASDDVQV